MREGFLDRAATLFCAVRAVERRGIFSDGTNVKHPEMVEGTAPLCWSRDIPNLKSVVVS